MMRKNAGEFDSLFGVSSESSRDDPISSVPGQMTFLISALNDALQTKFACVGWRDRGLSRFNS
jgi:hypothetical protein